MRSRSPRSPPLGKITGILGTAAWVVVSPLQKYFGRVVDQTGSFNEGIALAGLTPLVGYIALTLLWHEPKGELAPVK